MGQQIITGDYPPFPGMWVRRESLPEKLDSAGSLSAIAFFWPGVGWFTGITSYEKAQYWVRVRLDSGS